MDSLIFDVKMLKMHTTNYYNTFISTAEDCSAEDGQIPPIKNDNVTVANLQFNIIAQNPYKYTSDEVLFAVYAQRNSIAKAHWEDERLLFFAKGQPCFRASPLAKRYGWGVHFNQEGKMAIYAKGTEAYSQYIADSNLKQIKAMKSKR